MEAPTPLRPDEEVAGGYISATLGGQVKRLPVLPRARNRDFQKVYAEHIRTTLANAGKLDDLDDVIEVMSSSIDENQSLYGGSDYSNSTEDYSSGLGSGMDTGRRTGLTNSST